jgi:hypothetical protein
MPHRACTGPTKSLLAGPLAIALAAAIAACTSTSGPAATAGGSAAASGSGGSASGSTGNGGAAAGSGIAAGGGSASNGPGAAANVPVAARALICPPNALVGSDPLRPVGQTIPAGFQAVAVVQCAPVGTIAPATGAWTYVRKEVAITGLGPLLTALRERSDLRVGPNCLLPFTIRPRIALIGIDGAVIYPRIPVGVCGAPIPQVDASLAALHWIKLSTTIEPQPLRPQDPAGQGVLAPSTAVRPAS